MKNLFSLLIAVVIITSCKKESVDPIWGTEPVNQTYADDFPLGIFHKLGLADDTVAQKNLINSYRKQLTMNVIKNHPCIKDEKNIQFVFGSGKVEKVLSGDGKTYDGKFINELIIILNDPCVQDTLFLACGNGMLCQIQWTKKEVLGVAEQCRYLILPGQGLAHHLPKLKEWANIADCLTIPIRNKNGQIVSDYLTTLGKYESVLFPGDVIDVCLGKVFNKAGQEVQFQRRIKETKKANARRKKR